MLVDSAGWLTSLRASEKWQMRAGRVIKEAQWDVTRL